MNEAQIRSIVQSELKKIKAPSNASKNLFQKFASPLALGDLSIDFDTYLAKSDGTEGRVPLDVLGSFVNLSPYQARVSNQSELLTALSPEPGFSNIVVTAPITLDVTITSTFDVTLTFEKGASLTSSNTQWLLGPYKLSLIFTDTSDYNLIYNADNGVPFFLADGGSLYLENHIYKCNSSTGGGELISGHKIIAINGSFTTGDNDNSGFTASDNSQFINCSFISPNGLGTNLFTFNDCKTYGCTFINENDTNVPAVFATFGEDANIIATKYDGLGVVTINSLGQVVDFSKNGGSPATCIFNTIGKIYGVNIRSTILNIAAPDYKLVNVLAETSTNLVPADVGTPIINGSITNLETGDLEIDPTCENLTFTKAKIDTATTIYGLNMRFNDTVFTGGIATDSASSGILFECSTSGAVDLQGNFKRELNDTNIGNDAQFISTRASASLVFTYNGSTVDLTYSNNIDSMTANSMNNIIQVNIASGTFPDANYVPMGTVRHQAGISNTAGLSLVDNAGSRTATECQFYAFTTTGAFIPDSGAIYFIES